VGEDDRRNRSLTTDPERNRPYLSPSGIGTSACGTDRGLPLAYGSLAIETGAVQCDV
jgi:hypothetical protein